jgi:D-alanyl-D-alanine carboxypeptidase
MSGRKKTRTRYGRRKIRIHYGRLLLSLLTLGLLVFGASVLIAHITGGESKRADEAEAGRAAPEGEESVSTADLFGAFYFYEAENLSRYAVYAQRRTELSADEVVWRVNAKLDKAFYTDVTEITDFSPPLLVNKYRRLPDDFVPQDLVNTSSGQQMTADTKAAYEAMRDAAGALGYHISAVSGYRSIEYQKGLYNRYVMEEGKAIADSYSARDGHSEHHTGMAVDLVGPAGDLQGFVDTPEARWVAENARLYGFIVRYTEENADITGYIAEPWHVRWVGTEIADLMYAEGIESLEEYVVKYVDHRPPS